MNNSDEFERNAQEHTNTNNDHLHEGQKRDEDVIILGQSNTHATANVNEQAPPHSSTNEQTRENTFAKEPHDASQQGIPNEEPAHPNVPPKKPKPKKKGMFFHKHRSAVLIVACIVISLGGGFGGTLLALHFSNGAVRPVLYQSVDMDKKNVKTANTSISTIAEETMNSVVEIKTESVQTHSFYSQAIVSGAGSGVILTKDGYIVTNNHVIENTSKITVTTRAGKSYDAKLIGADSTSDLAVVKIDANNLQPAVLGDSSKLHVGDTAVAIGNPLGSLGGTVTNGIISALDREITIDNQKMHLLQTNAAINPGNSGGGLFNSKGELIGIVNAKSSGDSIEGLGFAIPINRAKDIITNLINNGYVKGRAALGVTLATGNTSNSPFSDDNTTQVYIYKVESGKAADKAGLKAGDQILKIDNEKISDMSDVTSIISSHKAGDTVKITVLRDNETKTISVTLGEASNTPQPQQKQQQEIQIPQAQGFGQ